MADFPKQRLFSNASIRKFIKRDYDSISQAFFKVISK